MRVGIITFYYKSHNYGGLLQSYALAHYISSLGVDCEQICYERANITPHLSIFKKAKHKIVRFANRTFFLKKNKKIKKFQEIIPHSSTIYTYNTINQCDNYYDAFIVGSDQMWNPDWYEPAHFLEFVSSKPKISYAVSIGKKNIRPAERKMFETIDSFSSISVREKDAQFLLLPFTKKRIVQCVDPVFLIKKEQWDSIAVDPSIKAPYLYCHFISDDKNLRRIAKKYAKTNRLKIVSLHHPSHFNKSDIFFGDIRINSAGPADFISLVKNASIVFTDSFHCCAFSVIFHKNFFAFHRLGNEGMSSRIESLTSLIQSPNHFCNISEKISLDYLNTQPNIDYDKSKETINSFIDSSKQFIDGALFNNLKND